MSFIEKGQYLIFDIETTGLDPETCHIVQFAGIIINDGQLTDEINFMIRPPTPIPKEASDVHGITDQMVEGCKSFDHFAPMILAFMEGVNLVAYNGLGFDIPVLFAELRRVFDLPESFLESVMMSCVDPLVYVRQKDRYIRGSGRHKLTAACARRGIPVDGAHDALSDCWMLLGLCRKMKVVIDDDFFREQLAKKKKQDEEYQSYLATVKKKEEMKSYLWAVKRRNADPEERFVFPFASEAEARAHAEHDDEIVMIRRARMTPAFDIDLLMDSADEYLYGEKDIISKSWEDNQIQASEADKRRLEEKLLEVFEAWLATVQVNAFEVVDLVPTK